MIIRKNEYINNKLKQLNIDKLENNQKIKILVDKRIKYKKCIEKICSHDKYYPEDHDRTDDIYINEFELGDECTCICKNRDMIYNDDDDDYITVYGRYNT